MEACRTAGILLLPVMPERSSRLLDLLGVPLSRRHWKDLGVERGWGREGIPSRDQSPIPLPPSEVLFPPKKA